MLLPDRMDPATDLIEHFKLDVGLFPDHTRHTFYHSDGSQNRRKVKVVKRWERQHDLGEGGCGTVWLEKDSEGDERAVKQISKGFCLRNGIDYRKEIAAMAKLTKYPELFVELHGWFDDDTKVFLAMEYFKHGDLQNFMDSPLSERDVGIITRQLLEGLNVMHKNGFTHRDLKPQNIFVVTGSPTWWVKIGDFGITKRIMDDETALRTEVGTRDYQAPEVFGFMDSEEELPYTSAVDLWALGCVMYRLLTLEKPFPKPSSLTLYCCSRKEFPVEPLYANDVSENAIEFIRRLMRAHPPERLDAEAALKFDWPGVQDSIPGLGSDPIAEEKAAANIPAHDGDTLLTQAIMSTSSKDNGGRSENDPIAEEKAAANIPAHNGDILPTQAIMSTSNKDNGSRSENDTDSGSSREVTVISHAPEIKHIQQPRLPFQVLRKHQKRKNLNRAWFLHGFELDGLDDEDVDHGNNIVSNRDTSNLVTKANSDITDHEEGLEKHPDLPAYLGKSEPDTTLKEALRLPFTETLYTTPAKSTATMLNCATHEIEQDSAALKQLHRAGYLLDVKTTSADLSTNLDATIALHWAAKSGCLRALKYLLDRGVNPSAIDNDEHSQKRAALHYAAISGYSKEVDILIERGADVQALDAESRSPLHHAATGGFRTISEALLNAGASVDMLTLSMETPLYCAAVNRHIDVVELLLDWGANLSAEDLESRTAKSESMDKRRLTLWGLFCELSLTRALQ